MADSCGSSSDGLDDFLRRDHVMTEQVASTAPDCTSLPTELVDLLHRMAMVEKGVSSDDSVSWHAHREAEKLTDVSVIAGLKAFMETAGSKDIRRAIYFVLGALGHNMKNEHCSEVLLRQVTAVQDKYELAALLDSIAKVPMLPGASLEPIFHLLADKRWLVRHSAIGALVNSYGDVVEDQLLAHLALTDDPFDKIYCHATLNKTGTTRSIPLLTEGLKSRKRDVKASARAAIDAIQARNK